MEVKVAHNASVCRSLKVRGPSSICSHLNFAHLLFIWLGALDRLSLFVRVAGIQKPIVIFVHKE